MTVPEDQISELSIDLTVVDGKVVYDRDRDGVINLPFWDDRGGGSFAVTPTVTSSK